MPKRETIMFLEARISEIQGKLLKGDIIKRRDAEG